MAGERLQKIIARAGVASRRRAEELIVAGRVAVNGRVIRDLGATAEPARDHVTLDGRLLEPETLRYLVVHKPPGVLCAVSDRFRRPLVVDLLRGEITERVFPAGRLDLDSEGLVLLTNDGDLMELVTRPGGRVDKRYHVTVEGQPDDLDLEKLASGIELDGQRTLPCSIGWRRRRAPACLEVILHEGKKNQIRRMFAGIGHPVRRLVRVAIGPVRLGTLGSGDYRLLGGAELEALHAAAGDRSGGTGELHAGGSADLDCDETTGSGSGAAPPQADR